MEEEDDILFDNSVSNTYNNNNTNDINNIDIERRKNAGVWIMKGVGDINDKKNIVLPSRCFITLINNAYAALAENADDDNRDENNLYTPVSVLKQKEDDNSFNNYIALKVGVDTSDALAKIKKVNTVDNIVSTIDRSKEGVGTIHIGDTPGTSNYNNNNIIKPSIEPSKVGVGKKRIQS